MSVDQNDHTRRIGSGTPALLALCRSAQVEPDEVYVRQIVHEVDEELIGTEFESQITTAERVLPRLDLHGRRGEVNAAQLSDVLRSDGHVLMLGREGQLLLVRGMRGAPEIYDEAQGEFIPLKRRQVRDLFASRGKHDVLVVDPPQMIHGLNHSSATPIVRIFRVLRAEWTDIGIVVLFAFVSGLLMLATPLAIESLVNTIAFGRFLQPVIVLALLLLGFLVLLAGIRVLQTIVVEIFQRRLFARVAADFSFRIPRVDAAFMSQHDVPVTVNYFMEVPTLQKTFAQMLMDGVTLILSAVIGLAVLALYHPWLLGFDILLLILVFTIIFGLGYGAFRSSIKESKQKHLVFAWLQNLASRMELLAIPGSRHFAAGRASQLIDEYLNARRYHFSILIRQIVASLLLQAVASTGLLGLGGWLVISDELTLGQLVAAELIVTAVLASFAKLGKHLESFYDLVASVEKIGHVLDLPLEQTTGTLTLTAAEPASISLDAVQHPRIGCLPRLAPQTREIASGAHVAIINPPGSQAETLLSILSAQFQPAGGRLAIDGINVREIHRKSLLDQIILVRDALIIPGTIVENIHMQRPDTSPSEVYEVLSLLDLVGELEDLPNGLNTELLPNGYPLNSRQRVLISIARAIAAEPRLLLIDGTLDLLDKQTGVNVLQLLCREDQPWTLILRTTRSEFAECCTETWTLTSN